MPASYEGGLRLVEHYLGRGSTSKQLRGVFPHLVAAPDIDVGRVVRNREGIMTGVAAQDYASISSHGTRPMGKFRMEAMPEDMLLPLLAFFHNVKYTQVTPPVGNTEVGTFQFGMIDAMPDHTGAVVGVYSTAAANYNGVVAMSDAYCIALERLFGHGHLADTDNGQLIDNFIANKLTFDVQRGADQVLVMGVEGFGRQGDELFDIVQATWGPGINGLLSSQSVLTPDKMSLTTFTVNAVDKTTTFADSFDGLSVEMENGIGPRDPLGYDLWQAFSTTKRPSAKVTIKAQHITSDFLAALKNSYKVAATFKFTTSATEYMQIKFPYLKVAESFNPQSGDMGSDVTVDVPLTAVVDTTGTVPLVEVEVKTSFDIRTISFHESPTLSLQP